jgi:ribosomal protein S19
MPEARRESTTEAPVGEVRWYRRLGRYGSKLELQQLWKVQEFYSDRRVLTRYEWRDVPVFPPLVGNGVSVEDGKTQEDSHD